MESIWSKTVETKERSQLPGDITAEAVVIGGGLSGILIASFLQERGVKTVVLEADRIGSGQTKNTTAKITCQHALIYDRLIQEFGIEKATQYADANLKAVEEFRRIVRLNNIECEFEDRPSYLYSLLGKEALQREAEAAKRLRIDAVFTTDTTLPFSVSSAVRFEGQAQFHPLKFLKAIAENLAVYENTKVLTVEENRVICAQGIVTAEHIVFASHYPFLNMPGYYFARMHQERSYVLALEDAAQLDGMYLSIDEDGLSFRNSGRLLLLGGGKHRTGENRKGGKYRMLRQKAAEFWPESKGISHWSAQDCITLDGIPYIGRYSASTPNWYVATGYGKWGMTSSMVSAMLLSDLIIGKENQNSEVFSPQRFIPSASIKNLFREGLHAVRDLSRQKLTPARAEAEALPAGHGGVVECNGEKIGVYKEENGKVYMVSTRCPHLGCQLEWNPDEKSWDCPCHGSRFDYKGKLIDNPAQEDLQDE